MGRMWLGIDPGLDGAAAVLHEDGTVEFFDTPTVKTANKRDYLEDEMAAFLAPFAGQVAALEQVSGRPGQGTASARSIGLGFGLWRGLLAGYGIGREIAAPAAWKRAFGLLGADKQASRLKAQQLFPATCDRLKLVKHADRAEALLLAEWCRRRHG